MHPHTSIVARPRATYVWVWFALDAFLALFPPLYWVAAQPKPMIFGLSCSLVYFGALSIFITASLLAAYWDDERRGAFKVSERAVGSAPVQSGSEIKS